MEKNKNCSCCNEKSQEVIIGDYVCYCNHVKEEDIVKAMEQGADTVEKVIQSTGAMLIVLLIILKVLAVIQILFMSLTNIESNKNLYV